MISGRNTLHRIDAALKDVRDRIGVAAREASAENQRLVELRQREAALHNRFAAVRLESLGADENGVDALDRVDRQAESLLDQHEAHITAMERSRDDAERALSDAEDERIRLEDDLNKRMEDHEAAASETRERLARDPAYEKLADAVESANAIVDHAASKHEVALADRTEKGKPYEADPLFTYLRNRKFATNDYRGGPLTTMLDRWVAGLIKYRDARLNYERLLEIPERLEEHLGACVEKADALADDLEAMERQALTDDGVDSLRDAVAKARASIEMLDEKITTLEQAHQEAVSTLADAVKGDTGPLAEARTLLIQTISTMPIPDLKVLAAETLSPEDDIVVEELAQHRLDRFALEDSEKAATRVMETQRRALSDLQRLRQRFKGARFDSHQSAFKSAEMIEILLSDFARGALGVDEVWKRLRQNHQVQRRDWHDDFGGDPWRDGFGLPQRRGRASGGSAGPLPDLGRTIAREIERELGRELGRLGRRGGGLGGSWGGGGTRWPSQRTRTRRRSRRVSRPPRISFPRSGGGGRRGGGGFRTGGGF